MKKFFIALGFSILTFGSGYALPTGQSIQEISRDNRNLLRPFLKQRSSLSSNLKRSGNGTTITRLMHDKITGSRVTTGGATLYGWLAFSDNSSLVNGLYEVNGQDLELKWATPFTESGSLEASWINEGRLCGYVNFSAWGYLYSASYVELNLETGEVYENDMIDTSSLLQTAAFNDNDGIVYGYGLMSGNRKCFMGVSPYTPEDKYMIKEITPGEFCLSLCYNKYEDSLYGININNDFVKISPEGEQEIIFNLGIDNVGQYPTGLAYNPQEGLYYWNVIYENNTGALITIDAANTTFDIYEFLPYGDQFYTLFCLNDTFNENRPARPEIDSYEFIDGSTTGQVTYTLPSKFMGGNSIIGDVQYNAYLDGEIYETGITSPGSNITIDYVNISTGMHVFGMAAEVNNVEGTMVTTRFYVGNDTPAAPEHVVLSKNKVTWNKVTKGIHNGYLDLSAIQYEVFIDGISYGITSNTEMNITLPDNVEWTLFTATVQAICNGMRSDMSNESNGVAGGEAMELPVFFLPTYEEFQLMTVVDGNQDGVGWYWVDVNPAAFCSGGYDNSKRMNDWLFLPPINFSSSNKVYTISFDLFSWFDYPEKGDYLEVVLCSSDSPDSVISTIIESVEPGGWYTPLKAEGVISVAQPGNYYVALHSISDPYSPGVLVNNISISDDGINSNSPAEVTDITAIPGENGALEATVSFTLPLKNIGGESLDPSMTLTATIEAANTINVSGKPGERLTATVETVQGTNNISITVSDGINNSLSSSISIYTGVDIPEIVQSLSGTVSSDMMSMTLTWEAPSIGTNGGVIDPSQVTYDIYIYELTFIGYMWMPYQLDVEGTSFTFTMEQGAEQQLVQLGVMSRNVAGTNNQIVVVDGVMGTPYNLPMVENFNNALTSLTYNPWVEYNPSPDYLASVWSFYYLADIDPSYSYDEIGLLAMTYEENSKARMGMPRFTTENISQVSLNLNIYNTLNLPKIKILGQYYGSEIIEIGEITLDNNIGMQVGTISLPSELMGKEWVQLYIEADFSSVTQYLFINELSVIAEEYGSVSEITQSSNRITSAKGEIVLQTNDCIDYTIYSSEGYKVDSGITSGSNTRINVNNGIYIVTLGDDIRKKVIVR